MEPAAASWSREGSQADRGAPGTQEPRGTGTSLLALQAQPSRPGCVCFSGEVGAQRRSQSRKRELHARPQPHTGPSWVHTLVTGADGLGAGLRAACSFQRAPPPPPQPPGSQLPRSPWGQLGEGTGAGGHGGHAHCTTNWTSAGQLPQPRTGTNPAPPLPAPDSGHHGPQKGWGSPRPDSTHGAPGAPRRCSLPLAVH